MPTAPTALPLLRLGRLRLTPALRALQPGPASGLVVTATVDVPESSSELPHAWDVAWADVVREAARLGADQRTAQALATGAGIARDRGSRVVVAARGDVLLARWLPPGTVGESVRAGPLPHLLEVTAAAARRPAHVLLEADRHGAAITADPADGEHPARRFAVGLRPGAQPDPHPDRPPALHHGPRHVTDREPVTGGERNAEFVAGQVREAAADIGAHVVLGAGDQQILGAISEHLPGSLGPVITIASGPVATDGEAQLGDAIAAALDQITGEAIRAVADRVASSASGPEPGAVCGIGPVAAQLAEQQVAALLVAADVAQHAAGRSYLIGERPTELIAADSGAGTPVPLEDGIVWAALNQDAIVAELPDNAGPLAGQPVAALLRRGAAA